MSSDSPARLQWYAGVFGWLFAFLLPLKFGSLSVMPEATSFFPEDMYALLIINWPAHSFGVVAGCWLLLALIAFPVPRNWWRTTAGRAALCLGMLPVLAALPGFIRAETLDYPMNQFFYLCGLASFYFAVYLTLSRRPEWGKYFMYALGAGTLLTAVSGFQQYFYGFAETREYLAQQMAAGLNVNYVMQSRIADDRVFATFVSCNALAGFLLLALPVTGYFLVKLSDRVEPVRVTRWLFLVLGLGGVLAVLLLTRSRGAVLCLVIAAALWCLDHPMKRWLKVTLIALGILAVTAGGVYVKYSSRGLLSANERVNYFTSSVQQLSEQPLTGYGWGGFFNRHMKIKTTDSDESARDPHNLFLAFGTQCGVFSLLAVMTAFLYPLLLAWRQRKKSLMHQCAFWASVVFLLHSSMEINLQIAAGMAALGLMLLLTLTPGQGGASSERSWPTFALLFMLAVAAIAGNYRIMQFDKALDQLFTVSRPGTRDAPKPDEAKIIYAFEAVKAIAPYSPFPFEAVGDYYLQNGKLSQAETYYLEAAKRTADKPSLHQRFADIAKLRHDYPTMRKHHERMRELFPSNPKYLNLE